MDQEKIEAMDIIFNYFKTLLFLRNNFILGIVEYKTKIYVSLGKLHPFMRISFNDKFIIIETGYPNHYQNHSKVYCELFVDETFKLFSKKPSKRNKEIRKLRSIIETIDNIAKLFHERIVFDIFEFDAHLKAEFFIQSIITKIRYMVTTNGPSLAHIKPDIKSNELTSLIDFATKEYELKVSKKRSKQKENKNGNC